MMKRLLIALLLCALSCIPCIAQSTNAAGSGSGTGWGNANSIGVTSPTNYASYTVAAGDSNNTNPVTASNFGFSIPTGSTIKGIVVSLYRKSQRTKLVVNSDGILLHKAGVGVGSAKGPGVQWGLSLQNEQWGSNNDLWGATWLPADINNSGFGVEFSPIYDNSTDTLTAFLAINECQITIWYQLGHGAKTSVSAIVGGK